MNILFDINHPAHVHFFRNAIHELIQRNHKVIITAREKEITDYLLNIFGLEHINVSRWGGSNILALGKEVLHHQKFIYTLLKKEDIDIVISIGGTFNVYASRFLRKPSLVFDDSERATFQNIITHPFASSVLTPSWYEKEIGKQQIRYMGFHELAYLHENYYKPTPHFKETLGLDEGDDYIIMRFVGWGASHDIGKTGFSLDHKRIAVKKLSKFTKIFITSEVKLPRDLDQYKISFPPEKIHDALYHALMLIGDSQTMTSEAAILGTPAIRSNSFVGPNDMMNFIELERNGLIYNIKNPNDAIKQALKLLRQNDLKKKWHEKRKKFLKNKIDVSRFMVWFIENYPKSVDIMRSDIGYQRRFV